MANAGAKLSSFPEVNDIQTGDMFPLLSGGDTNAKIDYATLADAIIAKLKSEDVVQAQTNNNNKIPSAGLVYGMNETIEDLQESTSTEQEEKSVTAEIVTVDDADGGEAGLTLNLEPTQSGSGDPWPAGGGKNLFYHEGNTSATVNGLTATFDGDTQTISVTGTNTGTSAYVLLTISCTGDIPRETPLASAILNAPSETYMNFAYRKNRLWYAVDNGGVIPADTDEDAPINVQLGVYSSATTINATGLHVQIEQGSTAPTEWTPYSNICPISGFDGLTVTRTGKNLLENELTTSTVNGTSFTVNADGSITVSGTPTAQTRVAIKRGLAWDGREVAVFSFGAMPTGTRVFARRIYNGTQNYPTINSAETTTIGAEIYDIYLEINTSFGGTAFTVYPQLELGSTATDYEPYAGNTYDITFPSEAGTVYGGTLDVVKGTLMVDRAVYTFDGTEDFESASNTQIETFNFFRWYSITFMNAIPNWALINSAIMTCYPVQNQLDYWYSGGIGKDSVAWTVKNYAGLCIKDSRYSTAEELKTSLIGQTIAYKLATPITYQLTPTEVTMLIGHNTIWMDADGKIKLDYKTNAIATKGDVNEAIARIKALAKITEAIAPVESSYTATQNYAIGDYLIVDYKLYKVTAAITSGATITEGTNVTATTIMAEIQALA